MNAYRKKKRRLLLRTPSPLIFPFKVRGLQLKDLRSSEILSIYESKFQDMTKSQRDQTALLDSKIAALEQADSLLAEYRSKSQSMGGQFQEMRVLVQASINPFLKLYPTGIQSNPTVLLLLLLPPPWPCISLGQRLGCVTVVFLFTSHDVSCCCCGCSVAGDTFRFVADTPFNLCVARCTPASC